ncbi:sugar transferase [Geomonas anaerohicana]|uniref:Sugar transferase n=1 Tax=Geomonas anaerohicana TaxID=2798583 RepID=A0ABS0YH27_9BACT|nr:sugar transferase [Geomonas anaerohicana]MBJ6751632.1 sugar transferase [Geomonas anaerohicana]
MGEVRWNNKSWWRCITLRKRATAGWFAHGFYPEATFEQKLVQERRRAERAGKPLLVMVIDAGSVAEDAYFVPSLGNLLRGSLRDTDIAGALGVDGIGVILTEVAAEKFSDAKHVVAAKVRSMLEAKYGDALAGRVTIGFRTYPETGGDDDAFDMLFYPDITSESIGKSTGTVVKRVIDLAGATISLLLLAPIFIIIPLAIKLTSKGPIFFVQERYGLNGAKFRLFKFRSMFVNNDDLIHRQFVKQLIDGAIVESEDTVYKITSDPRVTAVGKLLRAYSLDELPQLFNVLRGEMSLVGPRPPIHYEVENYSGWQRNRLIGKRPGITGAWQVSGRSSTTFDEMVRLDLHYLRNWSVILDVKIILLTPLVVLRCRGAY